MTLVAASFSRPAAWRRRYANSRMVGISVEELLAAAVSLTLASYHNLEQILLGHVQLFGFLGRTCIVGIIVEQLVEDKFILFMVYSTVFRRCKTWARQKEHASCKIRLRFDASCVGASLVAEHRNVDPQRPGCRSAPIPCGTPR